MGYHHRHHALTCTGAVFFGISWIWFGSYLFWLFLFTGLSLLLVGAVSHIRYRRHCHQMECHSYAHVETAPVVGYTQNYYPPQAYPPGAQPYPQPYGYPQQPYNGYNAMPPPPPGVYYQPPPPSGPGNPPPLH